MQKTIKKTRTVKTKKTVVDNQSEFDVLGSYTGIDLYDMFDEPVQDADDL